MREREALKRYLDEVASADAQDEVVIDPRALAAALEKVKKHSEPEAGLMRTGEGLPSRAAAPLRLRRFVTRHLREAALQGMNQRATPEIMRLRRSTLEHPFATLKYRIFGTHASRIGRY